MIKTYIHILYFAEAKLHLVGTSARLAAPLAAQWLNECQLCKWKPEHHAVERKTEELPPSLHAFGSHLFQVLSLRLVN